MVPSAKCQLMVYEQNTGTFNANTSGVFNQAVSDSFIQTAFQGVVAADQMGENDAAGVIIDRMDGRGVDAGGVG